MGASSRSVVIALLAAVVGVGVGVAIGLRLPRAPVSPSPPAPLAEAESLVTYEPVTFAVLTGWQHDPVAQALPAVQKSCAHFSKKPPAEMVGTEVISRPALAWQKACAGLNAASGDDDLRRKIEALFTPYAVVTPHENGAATTRGKFTGYYEADLKGSLTRQGPYQVPIYGLPRDLVTVDLKKFITDPPPALPSKLVGHIDASPAGSSLVPYFTRRQIDREQAIADLADVVAWADDPVAVHILHIQGSGRVSLDDGRVLHVGFAGSNGLAFRGIGSILLAQNVLKPGEANMDRVRAWLREHPVEAAKFMDENARYIFFRASLDEQDGPTGSLGVALTAERSLAVDPRFIPLGAFLWLDTTSPDGAPLQRLMAAQDTGAAITGAVRGDFFWGHGEAAFAQAARMNSPGRYFILIPKV